MFSQILKILILGQKKYNKRIFVITDGESEVKETDHIQPIIDQLNQSDTSVNVIAVDFWSSLDDSEEDEPKHDDKDEAEGEGDDPDNDPKPNGA